MKIHAPWLLVLTIPVACSHLNPAPVPRGDRPASAAVDAGLDRGEWSAIEAAYESARHAVTTVDGGHQARNPGQQWSTRFDGSGATTRPDAGDWQWGLQLVRYGFAGAEQVLTTARRVTTRGTRLTYRWDTALEEWYVNDRRGLEHGFTLRERPTPCATGPLVFTLAVRGALRACVDADGLGARFTDASDRAVLTYTGLHAFDADGLELDAALESVGEELRIRVDERDARYPITVDPLAQHAYLKASNTDAGDSFGSAVAVSGGTVVVGAYGEDSASRGVNSNQADNSALDAGAAYVFVFSGGRWSQQAYLKPSNTDRYDRFGCAVAISGDTIVVGAYGEDSSSTGVNGNQGNQRIGTSSGAAYVFTRSGTTWTQSAYLKATNTGAGDEFGRAVGVSGDTIVVGAHGEASNATGVNGNQLDNTAHYSGAAYIYRRIGSNWVFRAYLKASNTDTRDEFGAAVAISGGLIAIGALQESSDANGVNGNQGDNSAPRAGAVYVFERFGTVWRQRVYLKASNSDADDHFGESVAISGTTLVVGATGERSNARGVNGNQKDNSAALAGAAYVFHSFGPSWWQEAYLKASNTESTDRFGRSVAVSGDMVAVGAHHEGSAATGTNGDQSNNNAQNSGAVYVFARHKNRWGQQTFVKASNTGTGDQFGVAVAASADTIVVGAHFEDSRATGVNGNQKDDSMSKAGAAYVFRCKTPCATAIEAGVGCVARGAAPTLSGAPPVLGSRIQVALRGAPARRAGVHMVGTPHYAAVLGAGCSLFVDLGKPTITFGMSTDAIGSWTSPLLPVGTSPSTLGVTLAWQSGVVDPATPPIGVALSNGLWATVGY